MASDTPEPFVFTTSDSGIEAHEVATVTLQVSNNGQQRQLLIEKGGKPVFLGALPDDVAAHLARLLMPESEDDRPARFVAPPEKTAWWKPVATLRGWFRGQVITIVREEQAHQAYQYSRSIGAFQSVYSKRYG